MDTDALLAELTSGRLRAALDVTDPEPLPPVTRSGKHRGCCSHRTSAAACRWRRRAFRIAAEQIRPFAKGNMPTNLVHDGY